MAAWASAGGSGKTDDVETLDRVAQTTTPEEVAEIDIVVDENQDRGIRYGRVDRMVVYIG